MNDIDPMNITPKGHRTPQILPHTGFFRHSAWVMAPALLIWSAGLLQAQTPIQHLNATVTTSVIKNTAGAVTQWTNQAGALYHAVPAVGSVLYPSTSLSASGKLGLDFGASRNSLTLFSATDSDRWLNQTPSNPNGARGFCVLLAFKCDEIVPSLNDLIGNSTGIGSGFGMRYEGNGTYNVYMGGGKLAVSGRVAKNDTIVMALNYDAATGGWTFWDSKTGNSQTGITAAADFSTTGPVTLGSTTSTNRYINGMVGEIKIYDTVLASTQFEKEQNTLTSKWVGGFPKSRTLTQWALLSETMPNTGGPATTRTVALDYINGHLIMDTRGAQTGSTGTSTQVWDMSNPNKPTEILSARTGIPGPVHTYTNLITAPTPPSKSPGIYRVNGRGNSANQFTDPLNITPGAPAGYTPVDNGSRGLTLFPYQYHSGAKITDARNGSTVSEFSVGFFGALTPIGNLLIVAGIRAGERGLATYDIGDPANPVLLDYISPTDAVWLEDDPAYEYAFYKHFLVLPNSQGSAGRSDNCAFVSFKDPSNLQQVLHLPSATAPGPTSTGLWGRTRYAQFQDNTMFLGSGLYDMSPLLNTVPGAPTLIKALPHDGESMLPLGNLFVSAANMEQGPINDFPDSPANGFKMRVYAHQSAPDTAKPTVAYHNPPANALHQHVKSRIGIVIHETLDYASINSTSVRVFPVAGGADVVSTLNWHDKDILTITPSANLLPATQYRVQLTAGGIKDVSGNGIDAFSFDFTTAGPGSPLLINAQQITANYPNEVNTSVPLSVTATGGTPPLKYMWEFGDGTTTAPSTTAGTINHTYNTPGHYNVTVGISDSGSPPQSVSRTTIVTVARPLPPATVKPSRSGSQIATNNADESSTTRRRILTVNPDTNSVSLFTFNSTRKYADIPVGKNPRSIAIHNNRRMLVTCIDDDTLEMWTYSASGLGGFVSKVSFPRGSRPHDVVLSGDKLVAYVTLYGSGKVARMSVTDAGIGAPSYVDVGPTPAALAINGADDRLLITRFISPTSGGEIQQVTISNGTMTKVPNAIKLLPDTAANPEDGTSSRGLPNYLAGVVIDPYNEYAYVTAKKDNIYRGKWLDGKELNHDNTVRAMITRINLATNTEDPNFRIDMDDSSQPTAMAFSPRGDYLFITMQGNNHVRLLDLYSRKLTGKMATDLAPQGLHFDPDPAKEVLYVNCLTDRKLNYFALRISFQTGQFPTSPLASLTTSPDPVDATLLAAFEGKKIFYNANDERMGLEGYLSCASCHQDGGHDGRVWDFTGRGEGLRNTTTLRGKAGMGHGNLHWSGNFDAVQDFQTVIQGHFAGSGFTPTDLDKLAAYVTSLGSTTIEKSPHRELNGNLTAAASLGKALFNGTTPSVNGKSLSCTTCHTPSSGFNDSQVSLPSNPPTWLHNIGTIKPSSGKRLTLTLPGIDTPTLLGIHATAPYLHDGRAATLEDVFAEGNYLAGAVTPAKGAAHNISGNLNGYNLSPTEVINLIAYLKQLDGADVISLPALVQASAAPPSTDISMWRQDHFGSSANTGDGADTFDFDKDGLVNLLEYAFGLNPTLGGSVQVPSARVSGDNCVISFIEPSGITGIHYGAEWNETLAPDDWEPIPDTGTGGQHIFSVPMGTKPKLFMRLKVVNPQPDPVPTE
jgi:large repetitive protein